MTSGEAVDRCRQHGAASAIRRADVGIVESGVVIIVVVIIIVTPGVVVAVKSGGIVAGRIGAEKPGQRNERRGVIRAFFCDRKIEVGDNINKTRIRIGRGANEVD